MTPVYSRTQKTNWNVENIFTQKSCQLFHFQFFFLKLPQWTKRYLKTNLLCFSEFVTITIDDKGQVNAVYTDFSKAFDKIYHRLLLKKLDSIGVYTSTIRLSHSYISNRKRRVANNGHKFHLFNLTSGIPQGSHLGQLFFIIYIHSIQTCCEGFLFL